MEKKILKLVEDGENDAVAEIFNKMSEDELINLLQISTKDPATIIRAIIQNSPCSNKLEVSRCLMAYKQAIKLLQSNELPSKEASDLSGYLMMEVDAFPTSSLAVLISLYIENIKTGSYASGKWLEVFPKLLSVAGCRDNFTVKNDKMKGTNYKHHIIKEICSGSWHPKIVLHVVAMFKDVALDSNELKLVIDKTILMMKDLELQEIPPLVYQLLLLSTKGHKQTVLEGIADFFNEKDKSMISQSPEKSQSWTATQCRNSNNLHYTEGTVLLHITFSVKQDQDLGRELLKIFKNRQNIPSLILQSFSIALCLSIARSHRFEEQVFDLLKSAIFRSFKDVEKQEEAFWTSKVYPEKFSAIIPTLQTVKNSSFGWDHVTQGLVQLGFSLMDSYGSKLLFGKVVTLSFSLTPAQKANKLGEDILHNIFKSQEIVRAEILEQIFNRVVTQGKQMVLNYIELLSKIAASSPQSLLEFVPKLRELMDYLSFLPVSSSKGLLDALKFLLKINTRLRDAVIIVLRKAAFSRQLDARKIAANGFLIILKHFKISTFSSSVNQQSSSRENSSTNHAFCLEVLASLRRCLTQQSDVKLLIYEELHNVICNNPELSDDILDMLEAQIQQYFDEDKENLPPLKFANCISVQGEQVFVSEPLDHLLRCILQCSSKLSPKDGNGGRLQNILNSISKRMAKTDLEDLELDKSADFNTTTTVGIKNNILATLVQGVVEVTLEQCLSQGDYQKESCEQAIKLFIILQKLCNISKEKNAVNKKASKAPKSLFSIQFISYTMHGLFSDALPNHHEGLELLRLRTTFTPHIITVGLQKFQQILEDGICNSIEGNEKQLFNYICIIATVLVMQYSSEGTDNDDKNQNSLCMELLSIIISIVCKYYTNQLDIFLFCIEKDCTPSQAKGEIMDQDELIILHIEKIQRIIISIIKGDEDKHSTKDAVHLMSILTLLTSKFHNKSEKLLQVKSWLKQLCLEQAVDDIAFVKVCINLLLTLSHQTSDSIAEMIEVAQDIHAKVGDIDQETEVENRNHFTIINEKNATPTIFLVLCSHITHALDDVEWVIVRMKELMTANLARKNSDLLDEEETQPVEEEKALSLHLTNIIIGFHELIQTVIPVGACVVAILKELILLYNTLTTFTKYYLTVYNLCFARLNSGFRAMVKLSGTHLTKYIYPLFNFIQNAQAEKSSAANPDPKKKGKKKVDSVSEKAKILRETKSIPGLVFAIEQYERFLIQLSKKSKVNLMAHIKLSTSRDFRIKQDSLQAALEEQSDSDESTQLSTASSMIENTRPNKKVANSTQNSTLQSKKRKLIPETSPTYSTPQRAKRGRKKL